MNETIQYIDTNFLLHATQVPELCDKMQVFHSDTLSFADSGLSCDTFNIIHIKNGRSITKQGLLKTLEHFQKRNRDYCIWVNRENLTEQLKTDMSELLLSKQNEEVGMALDLSVYTPITSEKHAHILQVDTIQKLADYSHVIAANWTPPDDDVPTFYKRTSEHYLKEKNKGIALFTYYEKNSPLATVELFPSDKDTVGIYGLATLEDARGKGIGSALMTMALNRAKKEGFKRVVLQASKEGLGIYKKLGFDSYTTYYEYA